MLTDIDLGTAIAPLAPGGGTPEEHELIVNQLDLDGMMLNIDLFDPNTDNHELSTRIGSIHFTIDPISDETGAVIFDGGEIFTWDFTLPGANLPASFLFHGGHSWDTAFPVMATFGTVSENVNGLESVAEIPEPVTFALVMTGILLCFGLRKRRPRYDTT